ncbi:hypothetical protein HanIR_Chr15g0755351 [Helianthus annuus]|nr:hypothetical protein HanIR_Chr15g0755351 [Helianthus annuus]
MFLDLGIISVENSFCDFDWSRPVTRLFGLWKYPGWFKGVGVFLLDSRVRIYFGQMTAALFSHFQHVLLSTVLKLFFFKSCE